LFLLFPNELIGKNVENAENVVDHKGHKELKDDLEMGFHPMPRMTANPQRLLRVRGLGQRPSYKSSLLSLPTV
jgi:hypothetical protein